MICIAEKGNYTTLHDLYLFNCLDGSKLTRKLVRRSIYSFAPKERVGAIVTLALIGRVVQIQRFANKIGQLK